MPTAQPFFGWKVLAATFVLAIFGWGVGFYGPPVFLHAVVQRTGWSVALVSGAVTLHFLSGTIVVANLPRLYRRVGVPQATLGGAVLLALGVAGWSQAQAPWQLYAASVLSGMGWVALGAAAVNALIAPWFVRRRPAALGMAYNGASVGGIVFSPLWVFLIAQAGFAQAALWVGVAMVLVIALLARKVFAVTPQQLGQLPDGDTAATPAASSAAPLPRVSNLWRDRAFLTLAGGMALGLFAQIGLIAHLLSLLAPLLGAQTAGVAMGLATAAAIAGRMLVGALMPAGADRRKVACVAYAIQICGSLTLMLAADHAWAVWVGVVLFGSGIGNATSLPPLIAQTEFAREDTGRVVPLIVALSQGAYAFAPALFGLLRAVLDTTGQSMIGFLAVAALVQAAAIVCFMAGRGAAAARGNVPDDAAHALSPARPGAQQDRP
ncbi:MFS transporter [Achromobacter kerstersii]|uniref:MFS transporter n=1 Tax=Achromobacter kerstersii TaxID=1353890 RepID=UPI0006C44375|nr:MFS transporter [Achromobacter kerstersii]CUJ48731.1 oxalate/formate antiporter [Achromobacter kerstersii]